MARDTTMGWKLPVIILAMGCGGLFGMGMLADMLLNNPDAQAMIDFSTAVSERYPVQRVQVHPQKGGVTVYLWVDGEFRPKPGKKLPEAYSDFVDFFRKNYDGAAGTRALLVEFWREGEERLARHRFDLRPPNRDVRTGLEKLFGSKVEIRPQRQGKLVLRVPAGRPVDEVQLAAAAKLLATFKHGKWKLIDIRVGTQLFHFDGNGQPHSK